MEVSIMSAITKIYKAKFKEALLPLGFKLYRKTFYRVVNDVVQMLMFNNWDSDYTVEYAVRPLSLGLQSLEVGGLGIHEFRKGYFPNESKHWELHPCLFTGKSCQIYSLKDALSKCYQ